MIFTDNDQIIKEYKKLLIDQGKTQTEVAAALNMTRQALNSYMKKQFTFADVRRLLSVVGYDLYFSFVPISGNRCTDQHDTKK